MRQLCSMEVHKPAYSALPQHQGQGTAKHWSWKKQAAGCTWPVWERQSCHSSAISKSKSCSQLRVPITAGRPGEAERQLSWACMPLSLQPRADEGSSQLRCACMPLPEHTTPQCTCYTTTGQAGPKPGSREKEARYLPSAWRQAGGCGAGQLRGHRGRQAGIQLRGWQRAWDDRVHIAAVHLQPMPGEQEGGHPPQGLESSPMTHHNAPPPHPYHSTSRRVPSSPPRQPHTSISPWKEEAQKKDPGREHSTHQDLQIRLKQLLIHRDHGGQQVGPAGRTYAGKTKTISKFPSECMPQNQPVLPIPSLCAQNRAAQPPSPAALPP